MSISCEVTCSLLHSAHRTPSIYRSSLQLLERRQFESNERKRETTRNVLQVLSLFYRLNDTRPVPQSRVFTRAATIYALVAIAVSDHQ